RRQRPRFRGRREPSAAIRLPSRGSAACAPTRRTRPRFDAIRCRDRCDRRGRGGAMTSAARKPAAAPSALDKFVARCEAHPMRYAAGELSLHDAVDGLQDYATALGLVIELGQDAVQAIMVDAFAPPRSDVPRDDYDESTFAAACRAADERERKKQADPNIARLHRLLEDDVSIESAWHQISRPLGIPIATLWTAEYLVKQGDAERFRKWLARHSARERAAIQKHLEAKRCR